MRSRIRQDIRVSDLAGGCDWFWRNRARILALVLFWSRSPATNGLLLVINANDSPPFGTLITVNKANGHLSVGTKIPFAFATNGAEQPVWDPGMYRGVHKVVEGGITGQRNGSQRRRK